PPPVNGIAPSIAGSAAVGAQLTCAEGLWQFGPATYAFAWLRDGIAIPGDEAATHVVAMDDAGHALTCRVTATNAFGSTPADSASVTVPPLVPPVNTGRPAVAGTAAVGATLTCIPGTWTNAPTRFAYRWVVGGSLLAGATGA